MRLTYRQLFNDTVLHKYSDYYSDFRNKKLSKNSSVVYIEDNYFRTGFIELKDIEIEDGLILVDLPHIKTLKGSIPSNGTNCILI